MNFVDSLQIQLVMIEISELFKQMSKNYQENFLHYLADEYAAMDDDYSFLIQQVLECLYPRKSSWKVEDNLNQVLNTLSTVEQFQQFEVLLSNVLTYLKEYLDEND
jgi:hypothetical protein